MGHPLQVRLAKMLRLARLKKIVGGYFNARYGLVSELATFCPRPPGAVKHP
jgi:hypothetical protein